MNINHFISDKNQNTQFIEKAKSEIAQKVEVLHYDFLQKEIHLKRQLVLAKQELESAKLIKVTADDNLSASIIDLLLYIKSKEQKVKQLEEKLVDLQKDLDADKNFYQEVLELFS